MGSTANQIIAEIERSSFLPEVVVLQDLDFISLQEQVQVLCHLAHLRIRTLVFTRDVQKEWFVDAALARFLHLYDDFAELGIATGGENRLDVFAFGRGDVYWKNRRVTDWDGELAKSLFFFLIHRSPVSTDEILQSVWSDTKPDGGRNSFHVMKTRLRRMLNQDIFQHDNGLYRIAPDVHLYYDVHHFYDLQQEVAGENSAERAQRLQNSLRLARQTFLIGLNYDWVREPRKNLRRHRNALLVELGQLSEQYSDYEAAIGFMQRVMPSRSRQPEHVLHMLHLFDQVGRPCDGLAYAERVLSERPEARTKWLRVMQMVNALRQQCGK